MLLPIYKAIITDDEELGISAISLVEFPAVESDFLKFSKDKSKLLFNIQDEEQRIVTGVIMRCDFPIYRIGNSGYEYYIMYDKDTIIKMADKFLKNNTFNNINLEHNDKRFVEGVTLREIFIKDSNKGISPKGFEEIEDGSLFATYHIENDEVWEQIKNQTFKGFSLEGFFELELIEETVKEEPKEINTIEDLLEYINNYK